MAAALEELMFSVGKQAPEHKTRETRSLTLSKQG